MSSLLRFEKVSLAFGGVKALTDVTWEIPEKGVYGIIGPNGAGKSTLFNLATGIYRPTAGEIFFREKSLLGLTALEISQIGMARTFQNIRLLTHLSVMDNLIAAASAERSGTFWSSFFGLKKSQEQVSELFKRAQNLLGLFGLLGAQDHLPNSLSYGDQRKLEIARALMKKPKLLLLDEPAAGMNPVEKNDMAELLKMLSKDDLSVLVIDHDMKFMMGLCERVSVFSQGALFAEGSPAQIQNNPEVIQMYLGRRKLS